MSFRQTYYTSCEQGLRGGKGFQISAATEGIEPSILQQIERLGLYVPPVSSPSRPSSEEIERFPVSLLFQHLGDGSAVLAQAKYTGADYSGRFGNYFTHSLISSDPEQDLGREGLLPIELWGALMWSATESPHTGLPPLGHLEAGGVIDPERVAEFLAEGGRMQHLPVFLTAVESALSTGRRVVMVDDSQAVALWIAAASYALPRRLALKLSFNTYVKNPYQTEFLIVGTTSDSDFDFAPHEIEHQFYVFDFAGGRFTPLNEVSVFARMAAASYTADRVHVVAGFSHFVEQVAPDLTLEELDAAFTCHAMLAGFRPPGADDVRVVGWCSRHINQLEAGELLALIGPVIDEGATRDEIVDAYTSLYLTAINDPARTEVRQLIELPYLEWLIRKACGGSSVAILEHTAGRLHVRQSIKGEAAPLLLSWVKEVRQSNDARRLSPLFKIADEIGFFDADDDSLRLVGEEVVGPALTELSAREILERHLAKPGMRSVLGGVGTYLAARVGSPEAFRPLADVLSSEEVYNALVRYAFEQQAITLYFRLVGARIPYVTADPKIRLGAFMECVEGIRRVSSGLPGELVENAYDAVWQSSLPSFDEAVGLLDLLERLQVSGTNIPKRLVQLVAACDLLALEPKQQELINRLDARHPIYKTLGEKQTVIDAYRIPAELELSGDDLPQEVEGSLDFLEKHPELGKELIARAATVIARHLVNVKDSELHSRLLVRAYKRAGGPPFLDAYGGAVVVALQKPSNARAKVTARFIQVWTSVERANAKFIAGAMFEVFLPQAVAEWRSRELDDVDRELGHDLPALERWLSSREIASENGGPGLGERIGKWIGFGRKGTDKGDAGRMKPGRKH
ncbi:MAG TPA: hypothetical protein VGC87_15765 [Pyrinomonadaceae bacterium]|jgi:hypothetical protein